MGLTYEQYLRSDHWRKFRLDYLAVTGRTLCWVCKNPGEVLHHLTYERLGAEDYDDVALICRHCHDKVHGRA